MNEESNMSRMFWGYLSCIVFGTFGVHRFMLGRPLTGIVYALTGGLVGMGVLFDLIIGVPYMACVRGDY